MGAIASLVPQVYVISIALQADVNADVLKWNSAIIIITTVSCLHLKLDKIR